MHIVFRNSFTENHDVNVYTYLDIFIYPKLYKKDKSIFTFNAKIKKIRQLLYNISFYMSVLYFISILHI